MHSSDGFDYDINAARLNGNIFERIFHKTEVLKMSYIGFWSEIFGVFKK